MLYLIVIFGVLALSALLFRSSTSKFLFNTALAALLIVGTALCRLIHLLPLSASNKHGLCIIIARICFRLPFVLNPFITVKVTGQVKEFLNALKNAKQANGKGLFIMANHTSFLDAMIITGYFPSVSALCATKTLYKYSLGKIPLLGTLIRSCGHIPVYFTSKTSGVFKTDPDKMKASVERLEAHMNDGGSVCLFPEGQITKDPATLQSFRRGSFKNAIKYDLECWSLALKGCSTVWPAKASMGGGPGTVIMDIAKVDVGSEEHDHVSLSETCQKYMQAQLDAISKKEK